MTNHLTYGKPSRNDIIDSEEKPISIYHHLEESKLTLTEVLQILEERGDLDVD